MTVKDSTSKPELFPCPFCGSPDVYIKKSGDIFFGQYYGDRYPQKVAKQSNGYKARCEGCGCQTCWWHYEWEVFSAWNYRK